MPEIHHRSVAVSKPRFSRLMIGRFIKSTSAPVVAGDAQRPGRRSPRRFNRRRCRLAPFASLERVPKPSL